MASRQLRHVTRIRPIISGRFIVFVLQFCYFMKYELPGFKFQIYYNLLNLFIVPSRAQIVPSCDQIGSYFFEYGPTWLVRCNHVTKSRWKHMKTHIFVMKLITLLFLFQFQLFYLPIKVKGLWMLGAEKILGFLLNFTKITNFSKT